jgi:hypothetical protein
MNYGQYNHGITNFTAVGILRACGVTKVSNPDIYVGLLAQTQIVMQNQVLVTAQQLNEALIEKYKQDMGMMDEYRDFPRYMQVMKVALSSPQHIGIYYTFGGVIQAKFVDVKALGDESDLQEIQQAAYPYRGTLNNWIGLHEAWKAGESTAIENTIDTRINMMLSAGIAPFWHLVEIGNGRNAWPRNEGAHTLIDFKPVYIREMTKTYARIVALIKLIATAGTTIRPMESGMVSFNGQTFFGSSWKSASGTTVFAINGTERLLAGKLVARGFLLSPSGMVLKGWSGWLPR